MATSQLRRRYSISELELLYQATELTTFLQSGCGLSRKHSSVSLLENSCRFTKLPATHVVDVDTNKQDVGDV